RRMSPPFLSLLVLDHPVVGRSRIEHAYEFLERHLSVAAFNQCRHQCLIDRDVDPPADPNTASVGRRKKVSLSSQAFRIGRGHAKRDRRPTAEDLECTKNLPASAKTGMAPGSRFLRLWQCQAQPTQACEYRSLELCAAVHALTRTGASCAFGCFARNSVPSARIAITAPMKNAQR